MEMGREEGKGEVAPSWDVGRGPARRNQKARPSKRNEEKKKPWKNGEEIRGGTQRWRPPGG